MKPDEMIGTVESMRAGGSPWSHVAKAIGSSSGPAAMKRYQRAKKIGPYSKPRKRKPKTVYPGMQALLREGITQARETEKAAQREAEVFEEASKLLGWVTR